MDGIFNALHRGQAAAQQALDTQGRAMAPVLAVVTNNGDPEGLRRVRVALPQAPAIESPWLRRSLPWPYVDPPLPAIGQTVLVFSVDGDTMNGWYQSVSNEPNPPMGKSDAVADYWDSVPGNRRLGTGGDYASVIDGDESREAQSRVTTLKGKDELRADTTIKVEAGQSIRYETDSGASFELTATGFVVFRDVLGHEIRLGAGGALTWECTDIRFICNSATINGKQIATIGAVDSRGDSLISKGW
jgi:hypothetical protein